MYLQDRSYPVLHAVLNISRAWRETHRRDRMRGSGISSFAPVKVPIGPCTRTLPRPSKSKSGEGGRKAKESCLRYRFASYFVPSRTTPSTPATMLWRTRSAYGGSSGHLPLCLLSGSREYELSLWVKCRVPQMDTPIKRSGSNTWDLVWFTRIGGALPGQKLATVELGFSCHIDVAQTMATSNVLSNKRSSVPGEYPESHGLGRDPNSYKAGAILT
ncbi:hypothetical protein R1flu_005436 [Riccia fluitans]|uniref:Uncharacterized protein n=1 Tax=Riccia fluitans TaxID=41844 RepID=A0ABD1YW50_9MARC